MVLEEFIEGSEVSICWLSSYSSCLILILFYFALVRQKFCKISYRKVKVDISFIQWIRERVTSIYVRQFWKATKMQR